MTVTTSDRKDEDEPSAPLTFVVEDHSDIASLIAHTLGAGGFRCRVFPDGDTVLKAAQDHRPALILLDLMLPGAGGIEILQSLKSHQRTRAIRVIILSARGAQLDKVRALELGADDYVTKPFSPRELILRIRAVLRALPGASELNRTIQVGDLVADLDARMVTAKNEPVALTATEYDLLLQFMLHAGRTLSRERLLAEIRPLQQSTRDSRIIDVYVRRLRERIEAEPSHPCRLVTRRGGGYALLDPEN